MQFTTKFTAWIMAGILTMCAFAPAANACNLPYVDDVNDWGARSSFVTFCSLSNGHEKNVQWKIVDTKTKKKVKLELVHRYKNWFVASAVLKHKHTYKVSIRAKKHGKWCKWKTIGYTIYAK